MREAETDSPATAMLERLTEAVFCKANQAKTPPPAAPKATKEAKEINNVVLRVLLFFSIIITMGLGRRPRSASARSRQAYRFLRH